VFVITMLLRRRPDLSAEEFHAYWREHHGPLAVSTAEVTGIRRYMQLHAIPSAVGEGLAAARGAATSEWDGVALLWFDSEEAAVAAAMTPEGRAATSALLADEREFLDLPRCEFLISEDQTLIG
jgi:uncharacterized protein (TIGR02118 family)